MRLGWTWAMAVVVLAGVAGRAQAMPAEAPAGAEQAANAVAVVDMDAVVVSGVQPGPGLWRVVGSDGHVLYILGTQSPLPADMQWQASEVRRVLEQAGVVLGAPGVSVSADVGLLRGLTLVPAAMRAQRNADGRTLEELLPADVHARWGRLKAQYLGRDRGVEKKRPAIAAYELYKAALKHHGLRRGGLVAPVVDKAARARGLEPVSTVLAIKVSDPRKALADFRDEAMRPQDLECFVRTLDLVEHGLPQAARRANAWATGDLAELRAMPPDGNQILACLEAWVQTDTARKRGFTDVEARLRAQWLQAATAALAEHPVSFATLPIESLLHGQGGFVAGLAARGYQVQAPDHEPESVEGAKGPAPAAQLPPD